MLPVRAFSNASKWGKNHLSKDLHVTVSWIRYEDQAHPPITLARKCDSATQPCQVVTGARYILPLLDAAVANKGTIEMTFVYGLCSHCSPVTPLSILSEHCLVFRSVIPLFTKQGYERNTIYCLHTTAIVLIYLSNEMPLGSCHFPLPFPLNCIAISVDHRLLNLSRYRTLPKPTST